MGRKVENDTAALRAVEQCYRELRELRAITEQGFQQLGADVGELRKTTADTERKVAVTGAWNDLKFDAITWLTLLSIILVSQVYVSAARNAPDWLKKMLPGFSEPTTEQVAAPGNPESKQVLAFSRPGELLRKGAPLEGTPYSISSTVGWRFIFGAKDWHEGYDVPTPIGTPLHAVLPVEVSCNRSRGGGLQASYTVGTETHWWIHLSECNPGTYTTGEVFAKTGNSGSRTTGAHLDYRVKDGATGQWVRPYADVLRLTLNPDAEIANANPAVDATSTAALIKNFEGFHETPYWDFAQWSWGYGTKAPGPNARIDRAKAEQELLAYLERNCLPHITPLGLDAGKTSALASMCYNLGPAQFTGSETFQKAKAGNHQAAADAMLNWTKAGGKVLPGLVNRREKERSVYLGQ